MLKNCIGDMQGLEIPSEKEPAILESKDKFVVKALRGNELPGIDKTPTELFQTNYFNLLKL